jgi:pimeloyl-ACP methyl ester carboxylesterase
MADVVLIHGLGDNMYTMANFAESMEPSLTTWAADLLGHGERPLPDLLDIAAASEDLLSCLERSGLERPFLFGYSFGGQIGLYIARHHPDRVRGVCAFGTATAQNEWNLNFALSHYDPDRPRKHPLQGGEKELFRRIHLAFSESRSKPPQLSEDDMRQVQVPVLVLAGDSDPVVQVADPIRLHSLLPNARLMIYPGSAHPERVVPHSLVAQELLRFVNDVEAGRPL